jgi:hypothetical protein
MPNVNVENMEDNAIIFEEKMGFAHDADGLDLTDDQLVNFLLLCQKQYIMGKDKPPMRQGMAKRRRRSNGYLYRYWKFLF